MTNLTQWRADYITHTHPKCCIWKARWTPSDWPVSKPADIPVRLAWQQMNGFEDSWPISAAIIIILLHGSPPISPQWPARYLEHDIQWRTSVVRMRSTGPFRPREGFSKKTPQRG